MEVRGAPNRETAVGWWVSPWGEGGGSIVGVDERRLAWPCTDESEGEKREREGVVRWSAF
jgi:hypothetical protein